MNRWWECNPIAFTCLLESLVQHRSGKRMTFLMFAVSQYIFEYLNSLDAKRVMAEGIKHLMASSPSENMQKHVRNVVGKLRRAERIALKLLDYSMVAVGSWHLKSRSSHADARSVGG